jgi:hypothetical protein
LATSKRIAATTADRAIVTALSKEPTGCKNVLEWPAVDAYFQYAAIKRVFESVIMAET